MASRYQRRAAARYSASGCMSRLSEYAARPVNTVSARRSWRARAARVCSAIRSRPAAVSGPASTSRDSSTVSRPRSFLTIAAQSSGQGHRLTAKQLLMPSLARISALITGLLGAGQGQVAGVHVVVQGAVAGVGLGDRAGAVGGGDGLGDVSVDAGAQAGQHRGAGGGGVAGEVDHGGSGDVGLDLVPQRDPRAAAGDPQLGGLGGGACEGV